MKKGVFDINTTNAPKPKNTIYYVHCVIGLFFMFGFGMLEPIKPITVVGMQILGIFIGLLYSWSFVGILWPSLLGLAAIGLSNYGTMSDVLLRSFGDPVTVLVFFAMLLFGAIQHFGTTQYISRWFLTRKIINGRPVVFSFIFMITTYVLAALGASILPALLFMWSILYNVLNDVGYKKGDKYTTIMVIGTMFAAISGQAAKPFTGSSLAIIAAFQKTAKVSIDYLPYMLFGFIMAILAITVYCLLIKYVFRPDMSKIANISTERFEAEKLPPMDLRQKILFGCLFGYLILVLLPSILPKSLAITTFLNRLGPSGIIILFIVGLCAFKYKGKPLMDFKEIAARYIVWDIYLLIAVAMVISSALVDPKTGINLLLNNIMNPLLGEHSPLGYAVILAIMSVILANVANHAVVGIIIMPIVYSFSIKNGADPQGMVTLVTFGLHVGMLTAAASPFAALLLANKDWVDPNDVIKNGAIVVLAMMVLYVVVGAPLALIIFGN